jgi:hypothetical protein
MHVHWHLKHVAEKLDKLVDQYALDRLLLTGPVEATSELQHLLSKRVRNRVIERLSLPINASEHEVLEEALRVERRVEREMEKQIVEELIAGGDGHHPFTHGLGPRCARACEERMAVALRRRLQPSAPMHQLRHVALPEPDGSCDYCGGAIKPVDDLLEQMLERVLEQDGKIEEVKSDAAIRLQQVGNIGAILRF